MGGRGSRLSKVVTSRRFLLVVFVVIGPDA